MNVRQAIRRLSEAESITCKLCVVDSIDDKARTIDVTPLDDTAPILGVQLQANTSLSGGVVIYPKQGSHVAVAMTDSTTAVVISTSEVDKIEIAVCEDADTVTMTISNGNITLENDGGRLTISTDDKIMLNDGSHGGLVKIQELTDKINELVTAFNNHTHTIPTIVTNGSPTTQTAVQVAVPAPMSKAKRLNKSDYENTNITHG